MLNGRRAMRGLRARIRIIILMYLISPSVTRQLPLARKRLGGSDPGIDDLVAAGSSRTLGPGQLRVALLYRWSAGLPGLHSLGMVRCKRLCRLAAMGIVLGEEAADAGYRSAVCPTRHCLLRRAG